MINNVQLNTATQVNAVNKVSEDIVVKENEPVAPNVTENTDKLEISNEAHTASQNTQVVSKVASEDFPEIFTVNFWSKGLEE